MRRKTIQEIIEVAEKELKQNPTISTYHYIDGEEYRQRVKTVEEAIREAMNITLELLLNMIGPPGLLHEANKILDENPLW